MTHNRRLAYFALLTTALIWGSTIAVAKSTFDSLSPLQFLFLRYLFASALTLPLLIYFILKLRPNFRTLKKILLLEGLGTPLPLLILYEGVAKTSAIESSLISATSPIFTVLGGVFFLRERETKREWQGLTLSFLGTALLVIEPLLLGNDSLTFSFSGNLLVLTYNLLWTVYCLVAKRLYRKLNMLFISTLAFPLYTLIYLLLFPLLHTPLPAITPLLADQSLLFPLLYLALGSSLVAGTLYIWGQNMIEASEASIFTYLQGVVAIPVSFFLLGESPTFLSLLAMVIIFAGVYLAESRPIRRRTAKPRLTPRRKL